MTGQKRKGNVKTTCKSQGGGQEGRVEERRGNWSEGGGSRGMKRRKKEE